MRLDELKDLAPQDERQGIQEPKIAREAIAKNPKDISEHPAILPDKMDLFFIDLDGEKPTTSTSEAGPIVMSRPPSVSDSSEDEVVFTGRSNYWNRSRYTHDRNLETSPVSATVLNATTEIGTTEDELHFTVTKKLSQRMTNRKEQSLLTTPIGEGQSADETIKLNKNLPRRRRGRRRNKMLEDEAEIIADYIANMDKDDESSDALSTESPRSEDSPNVDDIRGLRPGSLTPGGLKYLEGSEGLVADILSDDQDDVSDDAADSECSGGLLEVQEHLLTKKGRKSKRSRKQNFPSAAGLADALEQDTYLGFDIMDFDRPSLRKKPKGNRHFNFELSDSDLELQLEKAWENDRTKKKARKQQREQLRSQGLLGRKAGKADLKTKHALGMSMDDLKSEVKDFLLSSSESLPLPPMNKKYRRVVHELASAVSLKSQSRGNGNARFPVLYKTSRTPRYTDRNISKVDEIFSQRRFSRRMGFSGEEKGPNSYSKGRRSRPNAAVSYADGDIVGASAPEIGADNKGRAMLEKMGWSTGTALGASNNKGILQPLAHVVKNSRAGLG
ncbi:hypothetical protein VTN77DRAFT_9185 [Rasamsonia byssochlamydoides]|uniref:uncharacterized protein n=1 Tax=Rasamsonia byssochlamydoides TaxID=89139 RepID=UPI003744943B